MHFREEKKHGYQILAKYAPSQQALDLIWEHSLFVAEKSSLIAKNFKVDQSLVFRGGLLHDLGCFFCLAEFGDNYSPYIQHGLIGFQILQKERLSKEALIARNHVGVGITRSEIKSKNLPLPLENFCPVTLEQKIVAYADKFHHKFKGPLSFGKVLERVSSWGEGKKSIFLSWHNSFS